MAATKASPTDLLWAYQLKREHQHLLTRIQSLETAKSQQDDRIEAAENTSRKSRDTDVSTLAKQVEALQHGGMEKRADALEKRVAEKLDDVQAASEAICLKVADVETTSERKIEEARKKALQTEKAMLKRVGELEIALPKIERKVEVIDERLDDGRVEKIGVTVHDLNGRLEEQQKELEGIDGRVAGVEHAQSELEAVTSRLEEESVRLITDMAQRPLQHSTTVVADGTTESLQQQDDEPRPEAGMNKKRKAAAPREKKKAGDKERAAARELAGLLDSSTTATPKPVKSPLAKEKPALRRGPGWIVVERTPSANMPPPAYIARTIEEVDAQSTTQASVAPKKRGRPVGSSQKRNFTLIETGNEIEVESQPSQRTRQTRSQFTKKPRLDYNVKHTMATAMQSDSQTKPKQTTTAATKKVTATPAAKPRGRPGKAAPKSKARDLVPVSQAVTVIESPILQPDSPLSSPLSSPSPPQRRELGRRPTASSTKPVVQPQKSGRRVIEQADTWEEFERQCAKY